MLHSCGAEFVLHFRYCINQFCVTSFLFSELGISPDLRGVRARFLYLHKAENLTLLTKLVSSRTFVVQLKADSTNR